MVWYASFLIRIRFWFCLFYSYSYRFWFRPLDLVWWFVNKARYFAFVCLLGSSFSSYLPLGLVVIVIIVGCRHLVTVVSAPWARRYCRHRVIVVSAPWARRYRYCRRRVIVISAPWARRYCRHYCGLSAHVLACPLGSSLSSFLEPSNHRHLAYLLVYYYYYYLFTGASRSIDLVDSWFDHSGFLRVWLEGMHIWGFRHHNDYKHPCISLADSWLVLEGQSVVPWELKTPWTYHKHQIHKVAPLQKCHTIL